MLLAMGPVLGRMGASVLLLLSGASLLCWTVARVESVPTSMLAFVPSRIPKAFSMATYGDSDSPWGVQSVLSGNASSLLRGAWSCLGVGEEAAEGDLQTICARTSCTSRSGGWGWA